MLFQGHPMICLFLCDLRGIVREIKIIRLAMLFYADRCMVKVRRHTFESLRKLTSFLNSEIKLEKTTQI